MGSIIADSHARRAYIEGHLEMCRDGAQRNLVELGRWLCRAKEEHIVEHGEWTDWVARHAGVNERTAQRLMKIAREIPEGSALEALGPAKLEELIKLPPAEREEAAEAMDAAGKSSRQVRDQVAAIRAERDEALRLVAEQKKAAAENLAAAEQQRRRDVQETAEKMRRIKERETQNVRAALQEKIRSLEAAVDKRERDIAELLNREPTIIRETPEDYDELREAVERLAEEKRRAEQEADRLADELDRVKTEKEKDAGVDAAARILSAIGGFIVMVGRDPVELTRDPDLISAGDWSLVMGKVAVVSTWCRSMEAAWLNREEGAR